MSKYRRRVAYWWLTGSSQSSGWSDYATTYVNPYVAIDQPAVGG